jgi:hypothetical protein
MGQSGAVFGTNWKGGKRNLIKRIERIHAFARLNFVLPPFVTPVYQFEQRVRQTRSAIVLSFVLGVADEGCGCAEFTG